MPDALSTPTQCRQCRAWFRAGVMQFVYVDGHGPYCESCVREACESETRVVTVSSRREDAE